MKNRYANVRCHHPEYIVLLLQRVSPYTTPPATWPLGPPRPKDQRSIHLWGDHGRDGMGTPRPTPSSHGRCSIRVSWYTTYSQKDWERPSPILSASSVVVVVAAAAAAFPSLLTSFSLPPLCLCICRSLFLPLSLCLPSSVFLLLSPNFHVSPIFRAWIPSHVVVGDGGRRSDR